MGKILAEIASQLEEPFPVECIELLPKGKIEKDGKTLCMGLPYADVRVYEDRLNVLVPGEWSTPPPTAIVAGQKLIVYVTVIVCGIPHSDVGEAFLVSESGNPSENAATESWAQAFKRACSQFGLGRYLYDLEKSWVPYNKQRRQIDLDGAGIARIVSGMYKKAGLPTPERMATEEQIGRIRKAYTVLKKGEPSIAGLTYEDANQLIEELNDEYAKSRKPVDLAQKAS